jgi:hypothetical protein
MGATEEELRGAIRLVECIHDPLCGGYRWHIQNEGALADLIAWTIQGHYQHAERILCSIPVTPISQRKSVKEQAVGLLTLEPNTKKNHWSRHHRDGHVFQHIAWIAAVIESPGRVATLMPHPRQADRGFDSLLIPLTTENAANSGVFICEEKATEKQRDTIREEVWPSIASLEAGERDQELNAHVMAILREYQVQNIDQVVADIHWLDHKAYRVSITITANQDSEARRRALFNGYDEHAKGAVNRRRAETIVLPNLRDWMDQFCDRVVAAIERA